MTRPTSKRRSERAPVHGRPLDATALEAVDRFVRVLGRCGCSSEDILRAFSEACSRLPKTRVIAQKSRAREIDDASHVLTVWFSDPLYLDPAGEPRWLRVRGVAPSVEALVRRVDPTLDADELVAYLRRTKALKCNGTRYAPRARSLSLRGARGPEIFRNLRSLVGLLRTLEHNMQPKSATRSWFEYWAENPAFPASARRAFDQRLDEIGMDFLRAVDADMHRREQKRRPGERAVRMAVGIYRFEDDAVENAAMTPSPSRRRRSLPRGKERRRT